MTHGSELIQGWTAAGLFTPSKILERLTTAIIRSGPVSKDEQSAALNELFLSFATDINGKRRLSRAAFVNFLQSTGALTDSASSTASADVLFDCLFYLSKIPFLPTRNAQIPSGLTFEELCRGLGWLLSTQPSFLPAGITGDRIDSRARTLNDWRRLIFQSLASSRDGQHLEHDTVEARSLSWRNAKEVDENEIFIAPNHDQDGDEMFHDLLQILTCAQPHYNDSVLGAGRADFLPLAHELHDKQDLHLHDLTIPPDRLKSFIKMLLLSQFDPVSMGRAEEQGRIPEVELNMVATSIVNAFRHVPGKDTTWQMFNETLRKLRTPGVEQVHLLDPILQIIPQALFHRSLRESFAGPQSVPDSCVGHILNPAVMTQLCTVLCETVWFEWLQCIHQWKRPPGPLIPRPHPPVQGNLNALAQILDISSAVRPERNRRVSTILAVSGRVVSPESDSGAESSTIYKFAVFLTDLAKDKQTIQRSIVEEGERTLMFELSPIHDVFRGVVGKKAWSIEGTELVFGDKGSGVSMVIARDAQHCTVKHTIAPGDSVYEGTPWRGNWSVDFEIETLEVWAELQD